MTTPPVPYHVRLTNVREVSLLGSAGLAYWQERLRPAGLRPADVGGRARVMILACASRFLLVPFREWSVSVLLSGPEPGAGRQGAFILHAFNSVRFFAYCERALFHTPYYPADVQVEPRHPAAVRVSRGGVAMFRAEMAPGAREPSRVGEEGWEGPIYLPATKAGAKDGERAFFGQVAGPTRVYPFTAQDAWALRPGAVASPLQPLLDSGLTLEEWHVREAATHAKSRTVPAASLPARA